MNYRISALQFAPRLLARDANLDGLSQLLRWVESDLVVLPELCTSGYLFASRLEAESAAEEFPAGPSCQAFLALARQLDCSIVYGFAERSGGRLFNSCALVNPDGSRHLYRKAHLFNREKLFFEPGDTGFNVFSAKAGIRIGLMICFDWQFPEAARTLALRGAQVICHPSNLVLPWCQQAMTTRSLENRVFSVTANRVGSETNGGETLAFTGQSQILNTRGEALARLNETESGVVTCSVDPGQALDKGVTPRNDAFADRRPELYHVGPLLKSTTDVTHTTQR